MENDEKNKKDDEYSVRDFIINVVATSVIFMAVVLLVKLVGERNDCWIFGIVSIMPSLVGGFIGGIYIDAARNIENLMMYPKIICVCIAIAICISFFTGVVFNLGEWFTYAILSCGFFYINMAICAYFS